MKITAFQPQIITKDAESVKKLFEELGFEKRHTKTITEPVRVTDIVMKNGEAVLDISQPDIELAGDIQAVRINVRDFEEAYELLISKGFENYYGSGRVMTSSSRSAVLRAPTGFVINLVEHIRDHE